MRDLLIFLSIVVIFLQLSMIFNYYKGRKKLVEKAKNRFKELEQNGEVITLLDTDPLLDEFKKIYKNKSISNQFINIVGDCYVEKIAYTVNHVKKVDITNFIGDFIIKLPYQIPLINGQSYKVEGIFDGKFLYPIKINDKGFIYKGEKNAV